MENRRMPPIGEDWAEFRKAVYTADEIAQSDIKTALVGEIIKARQAKGITQKQLEEMSGVKQPIIARMERGQTDPQISTIIKVLLPLGKTLAVVPLDGK